MSYTLSVGSDGTATTAQVVWSVNGKTYDFRSDNNFLAWITTIFEVADVLSGGGGLDLIYSDQIPPVQGGVGNLWAKYDTAGSVAGNARGVGAVDLQQNRLVATQVASGQYATVGGGGSNTASGNKSTVGGGYQNTASNYYATVGGGSYNTVNSALATIAGGYRNTASGYCATVGGGQSNTASGFRSTVGGGQSNTASNNFATVGGGLQNTASSDYATVGGGYDNTASDYGATVGGGQNNTASGQTATVGGGKGNTASGLRSTVGGGYNNTASGAYSTIAGGYLNEANTNSGGFIGGGYNNTNSGYNSSIVGGRGNSIPSGGDERFIGGGAGNTVTGDRSAVVCGQGNTVSGNYAIIGGGNNNTASANYAIVGGGQNNTASAYYATVGGGYNNTATALYASIPGGSGALADRYGMIASASGTFASQGDAQLVQFVLRNNSSGATPVNLKLDGSTTNLTIPNGKMMTCLIQITGINSTGVDTLNYFKQVSIKNVGGTTTLIHQNVVGGNYRTNPAMDAVVSADNANSCLQIQCTGLAGQTTRWVAVVMGTELAYA